MSEWFIKIGIEGQLATWLAASFLLYTLASQLAWHAQWFLPAAYSADDAFPPNPVPGGDLGRDDRLGHLMRGLRDHPLMPVAEETLRLIYYLGIPFMAAVNGLLGADVLGISGTDWETAKSVQGFLWEDWAQGLGFATGAALALVGLWFVGRLVSRRAGLAPVMLGVPRLLWQRLFDALYDQIHWAFYRSGPILWLNDAYWGTLCGLGLVLLEVGLNPAHWWQLKSPETAGAPLFRLGMAWLTALLFLETHNLWLTMGVHLILAGLLTTRQAGDYSSVDGVVG